jgi:hypothetical protein
MCRAEDVREGSIVFVKTEMVHAWFEKMHPLVKARYKLITHNSDACIGEREASYIDGKIIHWFAQNNTFKHEKITPIPIGLENAHWFMSGWTLMKMLRKLRSSSIGKNGRILFGFNVGTNPTERTAALSALRTSPHADEAKGWLKLPDYFKLLNEYSYVASPKGNGPDCHRTWEALLLGVAPITTRSVGVDYFVSLGLPIAALDDWQQLDSEWDKGMIRYVDHPAMRFDYWKDTIQKL